MIDSFDGENRFLSNFFICPVKWTNVTWPSSEHAYQAAKTMNPTEREMILRCVSAGDAKRIGRKITIRPDWDDIKVGVMRSILKEKFAIESLADALLATGEEELIEGNTWNDTFWGVCRGVGENWLGKLLMEIRTELQS